MVIGGVGVWGGGGWGVESANDEDEISYDLRVARLH